MSSPPPPAALSAQRSGLLAPHFTLALLCPHILDELTLAMLALPCHTNKVSAAENEAVESITNPSLHLSLFPCRFQGCLDVEEKSQNVPYGSRGCLETGETLKLVPSRGDLLLYLDLIPSVQGGLCGSAHQGLIVSACPCIAQQPDDIPGPRQRGVGLC